MVGTTGPDLVEHPADDRPLPAMVGERRRALRAEAIVLAWPAARTPTSLLAALPTGTFPGVDQTEVYQFLEAHAPR